METRNVRYNSVGTIDLEINHEKLGWIDFTASLNDPEELGQLLYAEVVEGLHGEIAPHVPSTNASITLAPDDLFGGPTIGETLNGN